MRKKTPESALLSLVLGYLAAEHVMAFRMNTGAIKVDKRLVRFGTPGMADILAFPSCAPLCVPRVFWLELKAPKGVQTDLQKSFQEQVQFQGHRYCVIRSLEDLKEALA